MSLRVPRGTRTSGVRADTGDFLISFRYTIGSISHSLRFSTWNYHDSLASIFCGLPNWLFFKRRAPRIPEDARHEVRLITWKLPPWSMTSISICSHVTNTARKATVAPLLANNFFFLIHEMLPAIFFEVDGSTNANESKAAFYISIYSVVQEPKLTHSTSSVLAQLSEIYDVLD